MISLFPLLPRWWAVVSLVICLLVTGSCYQMGEMAEASLAREYEITAIVHENADFALALAKAAVINEWLRDEVRDQRRVLNSRGLRREPAPF
jgi:hypothetical protein